MQLDLATRNFRAKNSISKNKSARYQFCSSKLEKVVMTFHPTYLFDLRMLSFVHNVLKIYLDLLPTPNVYTALMKFLLCTYFISYYQLRD